jgi:bile acid-coenzyme A ligase
LEHVVAAVAAWKLGAAVLPVDHRLPANERGRVLHLAGPQAVVVSDSWDMRHVDAGDLFSEPVQMDRLPERVADPGRIILSGGSTGKPKLIELLGPQGGVPGDPGVYSEIAGIRPGQVQLVPGPLYHNMPHGWLHIGMFHDHRIVLMERFEASLALDLIERHRVQFMAVVPTHMVRMLRTPGFEQRDLSSIQSVFHSAAPCPGWVKLGWIETVGAEAVHEAFGATEDIGMTAIRGGEWLVRPGSVGRPVRCDLRILDDAGRDLPVGHVGEVFMRRHDGARTHRYLGSAPVRRVDGFSSVGDLGWVDADGYLFPADRSDDLIISGGTNVYPAEVEGALLRHAEVVDVAVIGLADDDLGQRVHAVVEVADPAAPPSVESLRDHCRQHLAIHKCPRTFEFVTSLPRNDAGKLQRRRLISARQDSQPSR